MSHLGGCMGALRLILGDQLSYSISSLEGCSKKQDLILMCEVEEEATYVKRHKKKMVFIFSAMRHFASELSQKGYRVHYTKLDDKGNTGSFTGEVKRIAKQHKVERIIVTHPGEYRVLEAIQQWEKNLNVPVKIREDSRFLCQQKDFIDWSEGRKQLRMEHFYQSMRKKFSVLMDGNKPVGGKWNYDAQNRKPAREGERFPKPFRVDPDKTTREVITLVSKHFDTHFGDIHPFEWAVTRDQAIQALDLFISRHLKNFGDFQDMMIQGEPILYHAQISFYLNCGLLLPLECIQKAEAAYHKGAAPLNAVEGFIRQIMGWREYVRGIYWLRMPGYAKENYFNAKENLPNLYWTAKTQMNCLRQCVLETKQNAYAHHIQRLMILGNFALLIGVEPKQINAWFLIVYADAFEWVEMPNVMGMAVFADGGYLASKPYAASGRYIHKMSNYCKSCHYSVTQKTGKEACPFNYLYWNFIGKNQEKLESNFRMGMVYNTYQRMDKERQKAILEDSERFLKELNSV